MTGHGYAQYRRVAIETASPGELVLRLYARALNDLAQARQAIAGGDGARRHQTLTHAHEIVCALQQGLDMQKGGALAAELNRLYVYLRTRLLDANIRKDVSIITEVEGLLTQLHDAWRQAVHEQAALTAEAAPASADPAYAYAAR